MKQDTKNKTQGTQNGANKHTKNSNDRTAGQNGEAKTKNQEKNQEDSYLEKFFISQLQDIYYAEKKIADGLKVMQQACTTDELRDAFLEHGIQTQKHIKRLEKVFDSLDKKPEGKKCEAIEGILKEAESIIGETEQGSMTRDAALIFAAQKVEHYEIATYGGLVQFAITLGLHEEADVLDRTLREEEYTDSLLTEIAENDVNLAAEQEGVHYSWEKNNEPEEVENENKK
ncbi:MAG TPA: ferritin-like domain-containing protein [Puia sp.]|jgi:ferritin-like metal-binding protein YciE